jgi:ubiquinone/menaquinone biosynthesis C-methylase UbiE
MARVIDPEGVEAAALRRLVDFRGLRVLELGCGDGRVTSVYARDAAAVLAVDPAEESIAAARSALPADLADRVRFEVASAAELDVPPASFDLALFSWSL